MVCRNTKELKLHILYFSAEACQCQVKHQLAKRFKTPKDAEAWCSVQFENIITNAIPLAMVHCNVKTDTVQTDLVEFCLL